MGVEISDILYNIALDNMSKLHIDNVNISLMDAGKYVVPDTVTYIFMFNPFPEKVIAEVLDNINESLCRKKRKITIIYLQPVWSDVICKYGFVMTKYWKNYCIYEKE